MEAERFDDLTKDFATASSRRLFLKTLFAGAGGTLLSMGGATESLGKKAKEPKCKPLAHKCAANVECCSKNCDKNGKQCICPSNEIGCPQPKGQAQCVPICAPPGDPCKVNACDPTTGKCIVANAPNNTPCDDGSLCTAGDTCQNGTCTPGAKVTCPEAPNPCMESFCDPGTGCGFRAKSDGTSCNADNNECTNDTCLSGVCTPGTPKECASDDPCKVGVCNPATGNCETEDAPDGIPCADDDLCSTDDTCKNGTCQPGTTLVTCPESNDPCSEFVCVPATGICELQSRTDGTSCNADNNACTDDTCQSGVCTPGASKACPPSTDPCKVNVCDPVSGDCVTQNAPNGTACEDGNGCTTGDTCQGGTCQAGAVRTCPSSSNPCVDLVCNPTSGACEPRPKTGGACADGNPCTVNDTCQNGVCLGAPKSCPGEICCPPGGGSPGACKRPPGATCTNNGQCCNSCVGPTGARVCS